jgi:hypothetical protein
MECLPQWCDQQRGMFNSLLCERKAPTTTFAGPFSFTIVLRRIAGSIHQSLTRPRAVKGD